MTPFLRKLSWFLRRRHKDVDLEDELQFHLDEDTEERAAEGVPLDDARRAARRALGNLSIVLEDTRATWTWLWFATLMQDLRYAVRMLVKTPGFTLVAIGTLALAIGANTAIYSVVDQVLLRPLPYPDADRLATVTRHVERNGVAGDSYGQFGRTWFTLRDHASLLAVAASNDGTTGVNLVTPEQALFVRQTRVSAGFFGTLGVSPALGREFTAEEDQSHGPPAAILSDALWRRLFGPDPSVIGRSVMLRGEPYAVVGIMPAIFRTQEPVDLWTPLRASLTGEGGGQNYTIVARLRSGVTWAAADAQVATLGQDLLKNVPLAPGTRIRFGLTPLQQSRTAEVRQPLLLVWAAVGAVLLIGCINIAGLLLARASARAPEIATRMALGGGRLRIVRQLLTESLLLSLGGGVLGLALGTLTLRAVGPMLERAVGSAVTLDGRVLVVVGVMSLCTSVLFGSAPAWHLTRADIKGMLGDAGGPMVAGRSARWPKHAIVVAQVALSVVLVAGAGLLIRTLEHLTRLEPGFNGRHVLTATLSLQDARYVSGERINQLFDRTLERITQTPGVEHAAVALTLPYERALNDAFVLTGADDQRHIVNLTYVTPDYFEALRVPVLRGRAFDAADRRTTTPVLVVNQAFVRRYMSDGDPIGRKVTFDGPATVIVGVVGDIQQQSGWGNFGPVGPAPAVYVPATQVSDAAFKLEHTWFSPSWIVRTVGAPEELIRPMQQALRVVDRQLPISRFRTFDDVQADVFAAQRLQALLFACLSTLALVLASIGVYGLVAGDVDERRRDLGIRMALGATPRQTVQAAMRPGVVLSVVGVVLGLAMARAGSTVMRHLVFGVSVADGVTFGATAVIVLVVAWSAVAVPSLRLVRLNITKTLRES
jgi:predicted permease